MYVNENLMACRIQRRKLQSKAIGIGEDLIMFAVSIFFVLLPCTLGNKNVLTKFKTPARPKHCCLPDVRDLIPVHASAVDSSNSNRIECNHRFLKWWSEADECHHLYCMLIVLNARFSLVSLFLSTCNHSSVVTNKRIAFSFSIAWAYLVQYSAYVQWSSLKSHHVTINHLDTWMLFHTHYTNTSKVSS